MTSRPHVFAVLRVHVRHLLRAADRRNTDLRDHTLGKLTVAVAIAGGRAGDD